MAKKSSTGSKSVRKHTKSKSGKSKKGNFVLLMFLLFGVFIIVLFALNTLGEYEKDKIITGNSKSNNKVDVPDISRKNTNKASKNELPNKDKIVDVEKPITIETAKEAKTLNKDLVISDKVDEFYFVNSFDFGWPAYASTDIIVEHDGFALKYNETTEQADWVAYRLYGNKLKKNNSRADNVFLEDTKIKSGSALPDDYRNSGYDRGHFVPAADMSWSKEALHATFYMSNITPQLSTFNKGVWTRLENKVRDWAILNQELSVVTGPIIGKNPEKIGKSKVAVPEAYFKIILDIKEPEIKALAFIVPHIPSEDNILSFVTTIDEVEQLTGFDFFPLLPDEVEKKLESTINKAPW